mgnify:FL=1
MKKLKQLLEGYAWERRADGSLPTLSDVTTIHEQSKDYSSEMQGIEPEDPVDEQIDGPKMPSSLRDLDRRIKRIEKQLGIK